MASQFLKDIASSALLGTTPGVSRPSVKAPSPFDDDERMDISDRFRPRSDFTSPDSFYGGASIGGDDRDRYYTGSLNVTGLGGNVADKFVGMDKALGAAISPLGFNPLIAAGSFMSKKALTNIQDKMRAGEQGYGIGMLDGRIVGVAPGPFGGYVFTGVLPEGLSPQQRNELAKQLLAMGGPRPETDEGLGGPAGDIPDPDTGLTTPESEAGAGSFRPGIDTPATPSPDYTSPPSYDYYGDPGDDSGPPPGNQYTVPSSPAPDYTPPPSYDYYGDPGDDSATAGTPTQYSMDDIAQETEDAYSDSGGDDYSWDFKKGGRVGMADGGKADPVQGNGFVEGSPDNYTKAQTVADDENRQVREGSFVLNAPTTEKLQKAGLLPKGVDNSNKKSTIKANKGGLMDVALSKGEYVIEPEEAQRIGYSFLEQLNNQGKAEVDRRQGMKKGGPAGTDLSGMPPLAFGLRPPISTDTKPEGFIQTPPPMPDTGIPPMLINGIDIEKVGRALSLVETRGYENRNDGYFYTRSDTKSNPSSAFGPLQITGDTLAAMLDESDELRIQMNEDINPGFANYLERYATDARNKTNFRAFGLIYEGEKGKKAKGRAPTAAEKEMYKGLGTGSISLEDHKKYYPLLANLYLRYKAGMSDSEEDMVRRHFGNDKSTQKYRDAKVELGID